ncbi:16382_t:CDS:2, partial [Acaulospora morrowiae]
FNAVDHTDSMSDDPDDPNYLTNIPNTDSLADPINLSYTGGTTSSTNFVTDDLINNFDFDGPSDSMNLSYNSGFVGSTNITSSGDLSCSTKFPNAKYRANSSNMPAVPEVSIIVDNDIDSIGAQSDDSVSDDEFMPFNEHEAKDCLVVIKPNPLISSNKAAASSSSNTRGYSNKTSAVNFTPIRQLPSSAPSSYASQHSIAPDVSCTSTLPQKESSNSVIGSVNQRMESMWSSAIINSKGDSTRSSFTRTISQPYIFRTMITTTCQHNGANRSSSAARPTSNTAANISTVGVNPIPDSFVKSPVDPPSNFSVGDSSCDHKSGDETQITGGHTYSNSTYSYGSSNIDTHQFTSNQDSSWGGVDVAATPEIRVVSWISTIRRSNNTPANTTYFSQNLSLPSNYCRTDSSRSASTSNERMSIAYLCGNEVLDVNITRAPSHLSSSHEITRRCRICREKYKTKMPDINKRCARCTRHYDLFKIEWPLRKLPPQKGKAKDNKNGKTRTESINLNRVQKNGTSSNKAKGKQPSKPRSRSRAAAENSFPEPSGEWAPHPHQDYTVITKRYNKYVDNVCIPSAAYEYEWRGETIRWDANTGYVHMNPLKRLFDNPSLRLEKLRCFRPDWNSEKLVIVGGNIKYQGTWYPFDHAKRVVEEVVGVNIPGFHPVFGFSDRGILASSSSKKKRDTEDAEDREAESSKKLRV